MRYELPTVADLIRLGDRHEHAITVYARTKPGPNERENNFLTAKSGVDRALRALREHGIGNPLEEKLRARWTEIAADRFWAKLSRSLAIFIGDDFHQVYVLPNELENQMQVGRYFDIGQLARAVTAPQQAYALTLSADGWNLWQATPATRAEELPLVGEHAADAADATNRATIRGRGQVGRLVGDEGRNTLLETYAKRVAEAVNSELGQVDPAGRWPLYVFAAGTLLDMYRGTDHNRRLVAVPGAPEELRPDQIDTAIRESLDKLNASDNNVRVDEIGNDVSRGLVATDIVDIARAAAVGAVSTLVYNFVVDILGYLDDSTGEITYRDDGYDLLSRIAVKVLDRGGEVIAVRPDEITANIWNGNAVAALRYPLSR